jgi:hypothetical protein
MGKNAERQAILREESINIIKEIKHFKIIPATTPVTAFGFFVCLRKICKTGLDHKPYVNSLSHS